CCSYVVNWYAGVRYGHLEQELDTDFFLQGRTSVDTKINFDGVGPRLGIDGELGCKCGLSFYANTSISLLAGHFSADFTQNNQFAGNQGNLSFRDDRIVPVWDLELGASWTGCNGHLKLSAGYMISAWFNTLTTRDFITGVQTNNFTTNGDNLRDTL